MSQHNFAETFQKCLQTRKDDPSLASTQAYRLYNGYYEGLPALVVDRYANTVVISNHAKADQDLSVSIFSILRTIQKNLPEIETILLKSRHSKNEEDSKGKLIFGDSLPTKITENRVNYALDLRLNQDDSFYPDARNLRAWLTQNSENKKVLNLFAYTGSLGIAALSGGASEVLQTDLDGKFLNLAKSSAELNNFRGEMKLWRSEFYKAIARLKQDKSLFDILILDPPFFSETARSIIDLQKEYVNLVNKVRPLVAHEGKLVLVNNALYVSGSTIIEQINQMSQSGYLSLDEIIAVPKDVTGYPSTVLSKPPVDPSPFNHPTKISILHITRKDEAKAN